MCTSLTVPSYSNEQLLGRTMDFPTKTPWRLTYLPVNFEWQPVTGTTKYQSKFAVLGGMRHIQDCYLIGDGVNSAGLSVAELYFPVESNYYDAPVEGKINLSPQDFTTWLLTQNGTVKEIRAKLAQIALIGVQWYDNEAIYPFHWIITDASGTYIIEPTDHLLTLRENPSNVLTNTPNLDKQLTNLKKLMKTDFTAWNSIRSSLANYTGPTPNRSITTDRFIKTNLWRWRDSRNLTINSTTVTDFLKTVTIPKRNDNHDYTHYYGVMNLNAQEYRFEGVLHPVVTIANLSDLMTYDVPVELAEE